MVAADSFDWTDDRVIALKALWADGFSASQIADEWGGLSRNAVIGKVHRLGLGHLQRRIKLPPRKPSAGATAPPGCTIFELTNETCRWPIGEVGKPDFHFCGALDADLSRNIPYCPCHTKLAGGRQ